MWCHYCRKANHDDAQCFSTRPAGWMPKPEDAKPVPAPRFVVAVDASRVLSDLSDFKPGPPWAIYQLRR